MIGRDAELTVLRRLLDAAIDGHGGSVFIVGEAGIGKSRLAAATVEQAYHAEMALLQGRGSTLCTGVPLRPITEAVLSLLRSSTVDINALGPYGPVLGRLVPDWGTPPAQQENGSVVILAEAVLRLTGLAGQDTGCLMVLDDLQDADAETLMVVEYLIDNLHQQSTVLLGTIRADDSPALAVAHAAARRGKCTLVTLDRLGPDELREMVRACLDVTDDELPTAATDLIWGGSGGNPFLVEEILTAMVENQLLLRDARGWQLASPPPAALPAAFARSMGHRIEKLAPPARRLLSCGALIGQRFPVTVVQAATGLSDRDVLNHLNGELVAQMVTPDDQMSDWYAFRHRVTQESLLALIEPYDRRELAQSVADAVAKVHPDLPGEWCQISAALRLEAGDTLTAGRLFTEAGRRALAQGAATSAVALLDRAWELQAGSPGDVRADTLEALLQALGEAGLVSRALALVSSPDQVGELDPRRRASLHTRLAWTAMVAGQLTDATAQVEIARDLLGPDPAPQDEAPIDIVAAHLALDTPGKEQLEVAEALTRRAATVGAAVPLPVVACQAWQLLGALVRHRDPAEATRCLEKARSIAAEHDLPIWEVHALIRLGNDDALLHGTLDRLEQAREQARQVGAVTARQQAEASIALHLIMRGAYAPAQELIDQVHAATSRTKFTETTQYVLLLKAVLAAHQGRRPQMQKALAEFRSWGGDESLHTQRVHGLAGAFCALLEENRPLALAELSLAVGAEETNPTVFHLSGRLGLQPLLRAMADDISWAEYEELTSAPASQLRWDRQFALFTRAVLLGRAGQHEAATATVAEAMEVASLYAMGRHLALRLVAESALADGWGSPVPWLRAAEDYFHQANVEPVAHACRTMLRQAGARVAQRRQGAGEIPAGLRAMGVTVRELEVLRLLAGRLSNREIAARLHLSPRTVERHISSLIVKTGLPNRIALSDVATEIDKD
ncbi:helix-turn-helix transcriptional regulator [Micromonospora sp. CP22]|uniref:helix-turn-helix transcriptional regulator n=1 Tax=Micromonospora sp. CP22 TaxID=2580517 RepID=UPI0012BC82E0|nr:LuxR family transcriptional regulator [Micromonospora sp. CP22]MTK04796.1 winged helix-turn-helix transcriptional regulator [Micromonospora sp. CP22]